MPDSDGLSTTRTKRISSVTGSTSPADMNSDGRPGRALGDAGAGQRKGHAHRARSWHRVALVHTTQVLIVAVFVGVWQLAVDERWIDDFSYGSPSKIWSNLVDWSGDGYLWHHTLATLEEAGLGFLIAVVGAIPIGMILARVEFLDRVMAPFIDMANATPRFALLPLFVLFFGIGATTKIVLVISVVFFIMLINTIAGAKAVNEDYVRLGKICGASRVELFTRVILPATGGYLVAGFRLSVPYALAGAVVGEMLAGNEGLGYVVANQAGQLMISGVLAAVVALAILGWLLNKAVTLLVRRTPWVRGEEVRR